MPDDSGSVEKRTHARIKASLKIKYLMHGEIGEFQSLEEWRRAEKTGQVLDLSIGGMQIAVNSPIPVGTFLRVYFNLPNVANGLSINSEVVWSSQGKVGLCFVMVKNEYLVILRNYLGKNPG